MREGWAENKLGNLCVVLDNQRKPVAKINRNKGNYPYYGANGLLDYVDDYIFDGRYVLIGEDGANWDNNASSSYIVEGKTWVNNHAHVIKVNDLLNDEYLVYYLNYKDLNKFISGAIIKKLTQSSLKEITIEFPEKNYQEKIVKELNIISEMISKYDEQLKELDKLSQSIFYEMFGDPLENEKGWEVKKIVEIADATIGLTYKPENVADNGVIVLRSGNIQNSALDFTDILRVETNIPSHKYVKDGDILMCTRNGSLRHVGKVAIIKNLNEQMTYGAFMTVIRSEMNPYLYGYFNTPAFRDSLIHGKTTTINQITVKMLNETSLPIPPLPLQQSFARKIEAIEAMKSKVREAKKEAETLLAARMQYWFE